MNVRELTHALSGLGPDDQVYVEGEWPALLLVEEVKPTYARNFHGHIVILRLSEGLQRRSDR